MRWPMPSRSQNSSERLEKQIAREPSPIRSASSSSTTDWPRCARSIASDNPTGPAPTTTTGMFGHISARPILIGVPAVAELGFGLDHWKLLWPRACELAKLVASATILNPLAPPASTQIGAILANASSSESSARSRSEPDSGARKDGQGWRASESRKKRRAARPLQIRAVPAEPAGGRSLLGAFGRVSGALRARHSGMARAGDAGFSRSTPAARNTSPIAPAPINRPSAARSPR